MKEKKMTVLLAVALAAVLLGAAALYRALPERENAAPETPPEAERIIAPDFTVLDAEGNSVALSDYVGTPVVLNFWASWCGPCKSEMPDFDAVASELSGKVQFMMVNLTDGGRETAETAAQFIEEQGYTFPVFFDTLSEGADAYSVRSIPATYFIDADGTLLAHSAGSLDETRLRQGIDLLLK